MKTTGTSKVQCFLSRRSGPLSARDEGCEPPKHGGGGGEVQQGGGGDQHLHEGRQKSPSCCPSTNHQNDCDQFTNKRQCILENVAFNKFTLSPLPVLLNV